MTPVVLSRSHALFASLGRFSVILASLNSTFVRLSPSSVLAPFFPVRPIATDLPPCDYSFARCLFMQVRNVAYCSLSLVRPLHTYVFLFCFSALCYLFPVLPRTRDCYPPSPGYLPTSRFVMNIVLKELLCSPSDAPPGLQLHKSHTCSNPATSLLSDCLIGFL